MSLRAGGCVVQRKSAVTAFDRAYLCKRDEFVCGHVGAGSDRDVWCSTLQFNDLC